MAICFKVIFYYHVWLVVSTYPSEKYEFVRLGLSFPIYGKIDWIIIPTIGENKIHVPNLQPDFVLKTSPCVTLFLGLWDHDRWKKRPNKDHLEGLKKNVRSQKNAVPSGKLT